MGAGYLIDTNGISILRRRKPEPRVLQWFKQRPASQLSLSVSSLGEIRCGVEMLEAGERRRELRNGLEQNLPAFFAGHELSIDGVVAHRGGHLMADIGRPLLAIDSLLAATALEYNLLLFIRNLNDVAVINPWEPEDGSPP